MIPALPEAQQQFIRKAFPETGDAWIADYPHIVASCVDRWSLAHLERAEGGYPTNVVFFAAAQRGREVVLKLGHPHPELRTEAIALRAYDGSLTPQLLDEDPEVPALLMERMRPGDTLRHSPRRREFDYAIFGQIGWRCDQYAGLPHYHDWMNIAFADSRKRFSSNELLMAHMDRAESLYSGLRGDDSWFLHGDLHHENLLADEERGWVAIDPKGVIGPRVMECGRFLHNFLQDETQAAASIAETADIAETRCHQLAQVMGVGVREVARAGYIDALLGACWMLNDRLLSASRLKDARHEVSAAVSVMEQLL